MTSPDTAADVVAFALINGVGENLVRKSTLDAANARVVELEADLAAAEADTRDEAYREGYEEGKSEWRGVKAQLWNAMQQWLTLRHGLVDMTGEGYTVSDLLNGLAEVEAENKRLRALSVPPSRIEDVVPSEALPINLKLAKLRFFRDMVDADRAKVFTAFFGPEIAAEATTHGHQSMLFDHMVGGRAALTKVQS